MTAPIPESKNRDISRSAEASITGHKLVPLERLQSARPSQRTQAYSPAESVPPLEVRARSHSNDISHVQTWTKYASGFGAYVRRALLTEVVDLGRTNIGRDGLIRKLAYLDPCESAHVHVKCRSRPTWIDCVTNIRKFINFWHPGNINNSGGYVVEESCLIPSGECFLEEYRPFSLKCFFMIFSLPYVVNLGHASQYTEGTMIATHICARVL